MKMKIINKEDMEDMGLGIYNKLSKKSFDDCRFNVKNQKIFTTLEIPQKLKNKVFKELKHRKTELKK